MTEWIKCSDSMPDSDPDYDEDNEYIAYCAYLNRFQMYFMKFPQKSGNQVWKYCKVLYWMKAPKTPDQIEKEREEYANSDYCRFIRSYVDGFFDRYKVPVEVKND